MPNTRNCSKKLKQDIVKFFDECTNAQHQFAEILNSLGPNLRARQAECLNTIQSVEEWEKAKAKIVLDCGFWIENNLKEPKRVKYSTNLLHSELEYASESLADNFCKLESPKLLFFSELKKMENGYAWRENMSAKTWPATLVKNYDDLYKIVGIASELRLERDELLDFLDQEENYSLLCYPSQPMWKIFTKWCMDLYMQPCRVQFDGVDVFDKTESCTNLHESSDPNHVATLFIGTDYWGDGGYIVNNEHVPLGNLGSLIVKTGTPYILDHASWNPNFALKFKIFLASSPQKDFVLYFPSSDPNFSFTSMIDYYNPQDAENSEAIMEEDDYDEDDDDEKDAVVSNAPADFFTNHVMFENFYWTEFDVDTVVNRILSFRFIRNRIGIVLHNHYPQKDIVAGSLTERDSAMYNILAKNPNVSNIQLTGIRLCQDWTFYSANAAAVKTQTSGGSIENVVSIYLPDDSKIFKLRDVIFPAKNHIMKKLANLTKNMTTQHVEGQAWFNAALCTVDFK